MPLSLNPVACPGLPTPQNAYDPICEVVLTCANGTDPDNGTDPGNCTSYLESTKCSFFCVPGYTGTTDDLFVLCQGDGTWLTNGACVPETCNASYCGNFTRVCLPSALPLCFCSSCFFHSMLLWALWSSFSFCSDFPPVFAQCHGSNSTDPNNSTDCFCAETVDGEPFCGFSSGDCGKSCTSTSDCDLGRACIINSCCLSKGGVCVDVCPIPIDLDDKDLDLASALPEWSGYSSWSGY